MLSPLEIPEKDLMSGDVVEMCVWIQCARAHPHTHLF